MYINTYNFYLHVRENWKHLIIIAYVLAHENIYYIYMLMPQVTFNYEET